MCDIEVDVSSLDDDALLQCKAHHHLLHRGGFFLERVDGRLVFTRPDGTEIHAPTITV